MDRGRVSAVVLAIFVGYERWRTRTVGSPLMPLGLFRARTFSAGMAIWLIFWIALGGFFLAWMLYLQIGLGWTPLHAGLTAVTFAVGAAAGPACRCRCSRRGSAAGCWWQGRC